VRARVCIYIYNTWRRRDDTEPRAICCFYDLEDRAYNNSVGSASKRHPRLPTPVARPPPPRSTGRGLLHHRNPRGVHGMADTRAYPLLILILDGERSSIPSPSHPSASPPSPTFVEFRRRRRGVRNTREPLPLKYRSGFLRRGMPTYCDPCLHAGLLD